MNKIYKTTNYAVGDFLIKVKNASMAKNKEIKVDATKKIVALAEALKKMGYVDSVKKVSDPDGKKDGLVVGLTFKNKRPLLLDVKLVSKPGLRVYMSVAEIEKKKSPSLYLISSPKGLMSSNQAIKLRTGGEVIAEIL